MNLKFTKNTTTWVVDHNGLSYVRTDYHSKDEFSISWHRSFDWNKEVANKIVSEIELEQMFSQLIIDKMKSNSGQVEESQNISNGDPLSDWIYTPS